MLVMLAPASVLATAYTGSVTGNWNNSATWGGAGVPGAADTVTISAGITVTVSDAEACTQIVMNRASGNNSDLIIGTGGTLTLGSTITQTGSSGTATVDLSSGSGTLILNYVGQPIGSSVTLTCGTAGSTVEYTGAGNQTMNAPSGGYDNLTLAGSSTKSQAVTITGTLTISGSGVVFGSTPTYGANASLVYSGISGSPSKEWLNTMAVPVTLQNSSSLIAGFGGSSTTTANVSVNAGCSLVLSTKTLTVNTPGVLYIYGTVDVTNNSNGTLAGTGGCIVENGGVLKSDIGGKSTLISISSVEVMGGGTIQSYGASGMVPATTWDAGSTLQLLGTGTPTLSVSQTFQNVIVSNSSSCTIGTACAINGPLTLTAGSLAVSATKPTLATGANIIVTAGTLSGSPTFGSTVNVTYNNTSATVAGGEIPAGSTVLNNLTNSDPAGITLTANTTINGTLATVYNGSTPAIAIPTNTLTLNNNPVVITVSGATLANDANYTIASTTSGAVTGSTLGSLTVNGSGAPVGATGESVSDGTGQLVLTVAGGAASKLQVVLPGQTGGAGPVLGTPTAQTESIPFTATIYAVDSGGYRVTSATPTVNFTSSDGAASLPSNGSTTLASGRATANVTLNTVGSQTISVNDQASVLTANTSSSVSVLGVTYLQTAPAPTSIIYGQTLSASTLVGGSCTNKQGVNLPGNFVFTTPTIAPATGTTNVSVTFTPTSGSYSTISFNVTVTVNQATPIVSNTPAASAIYVSQALSSSILSGGACTNLAGTIVPGTFAFTSPTTTPPLGTANQSVTFTPTDTTDYSSISFNVSVTVTAFATTTLTPTSTSPWTVPPGVTSITVQMWGGGGAGGGALGNNIAYGGGGGGGGGYSTATLTGLTPGSTIAFSVGAGGTGSAGGGGTVGGDTSFTGVTTAGGGGGGIQAPTSTGGSAGTGGAFNGGTGDTGTASFGAGGGSGAGTNAAGVNASTTAGGVSSAGGGTGGTGLTTSGSTGPAGSAPGGGGAGAFEHGTTARPGGAGGNGEIVIVNATSGGAPPTLNFVQSGSTLTFSWTGSYHLQSQTNSPSTGLNGNWSNYPGGGSSPVGVTINPANPSVFFRLSQ